MTRYCGNNYGVMSFFWLVLIVARSDIKSQYPAIKPVHSKKLSIFRSRKSVVDFYRVCRKSLSNGEVHQKQCGASFFGDYHQFSVVIMVKLG